MLPDYEDERLARLLWWFETYLKIPYRFSRSKRRSPQPKAVCWFKPTAAEHIARMFEMA
jgi:hypothetical protein